MMMAAPGMGYIQMAPSQFGQIGMSHLGPVLIQPFPVQAARAASAPVSIKIRIKSYLRWLGEKLSDNLILPRWINQRDPRADQVPLKLRIKKPSIPNFHSRIWNIKKNLENVQILKFRELERRAFWQLWNYEIVNSI